MSTDKQEGMTIEQLLKPRFKLIEDYPGNSQPLGNITIEVATASYFRKFRANFKELEWWDERQEKDLPEFVKDGYGEVFRVEAYSGGPYVSLYKNNRDPHDFPMGGHSLFQLLPATKEEYDTFKTK